MASEIPSRVVLTGFMGTGKTEVGKRLGQLLGRPFIDLDRAIESAEGMRVAEIFSRRGEPAFRAIEAREAARVARLTQTVIATGGGTLLSGGGALLDDATRERLAGEGARVFVLCADPGEIARRVGSDRSARPLLAGGDVLNRVETLLAERAPHYAALGERVETTGRSVDEVARDIASRLSPPAAAEPGP